MKHSPKKTSRRLRFPLQLHSLWFKINLCFVLPIFLFMAVWLLMLSREAAQKNTTELQRYRQSVDQQIIDTLESNANVLHMQSYSVYDEKEALLTLYQGPSEAGYFSARTRFQSTMSNFMMLTDRFDGIALMDFDGNVLFMLDRLHSGHNSKIDPDTPWYRNILHGTSKNRSIFFTDQLLSNHTTIVATCKNLYSSEHFEKIGILVCFCYENKFMQSLSDSIVMNGEYVELYSAEDTLLFSAGSADKHSDNMLCSVTESNAYGWKLISHIPRSTFQLSSFLRTSNIAVFLLILVLSFLISALLSRQITSPLEQLNTSFQRVQTGDFDATVCIKGQDELAQIGVAYNHMLSQLKTLTRERYVLKLAKTQSELEALQAQINPHFLFNTLNSIKAICDNGQAENASQMVQALSSLMRYTLSHGKYLVSFSEELHILQTYLYLQSYRFEGRYTVTYDIEDEVLGLSIPRLSLQPLVENAIKHGLERSCEPGKLIVTAKLIGKQLMIYISNTGMSIPADRLQVLNQQLQEISGSVSFQNNSIGLMNVCYRLRLHYAEQSQMSISSTDKFTTVRLLLPAKPYLPDLSDLPENSPPKKSEVL